MTSSAHLDPEALADLQEGLLDADAAARAGAHLAQCARCRADDEALQRVHELLSGAPDPGPVPADVAARLDLSLADAAAAPAPGVASVDVTPLRPRQARPAFASRVLQAAAVLVLVLVGAGVAVSALQNRNDDSSSSTAGAAAGRETTSEAPAPSDNARTSFLASGRNYTPGSLPVAAQQLVSGAEPSVGAGNEPQALASAPGDLARLGPGAPLAECATALAEGGPATPLAVDLARFQGKPAAVVVLPTRGDPATMDVWVVAPDCAAANASVLSFARVARP